MRDIEANGGTAIFARVDVSAAQEIESAAKRAVEELGRLDVILDGAGRSGRPGLIATPMSQRAQANEAIRARLSELQPLTGDFGQPIDVAQAALYLASDQVKCVTGTVLTVAGGWTVH